MKDKLARLRALDYRHYIAAAITLGFLACALIFLNALPRVAEAFRDLGTSCAYYVMALGNGENPVSATVNQMPSWEFAPSRFAPLRIFPWTWEEFKLLWGKFTEALFSSENFRAYWWRVTDVLYYLSKGLLVLLPLVLALVMFGKRYLKERTDAILERCLALFEEKAEQGVPFAQSIVDIWRIIVSEIKKKDYDFGKLQSVFQAVELAFPQGTDLVLGEILKTFRIEYSKAFFYNRDSKPLALWRKFTFRIVYPIRDWLRGFVAFLCENARYGKLWILLWALYFNAIVIVVEFIAFYLYLISSFDFAAIYPQLVKLLIDLAPAVRFLPGVVWAAVGLWLFDHLCRNAAYDRLYAKEAKNTAFVEDRGVVTIVYGPMGVGKTSLLTSLSLTAEVKMRNDAFEILIERDMMFPAFPWCQLRSEIRYQIEHGYIVDTNSCKRFARQWEQDHKYITEDPSRVKWLARSYRKGHFRWRDFVFHYDTEHYPMTYDGELGSVTLWDAIEDYTCAYYIFTIQTSLIISNYSIRTDQIVADLGNMPLWDSDFFKRDPRLMDAYSRYAHIIDFDMLRLGKRMLANNPNRNAFGFGVYVVSEIDKERKNALELRETKKNTDECNQVNDLFNACLKMSRHACVIANRVFLKIFCDLQRPEDWGAGGREVGEIVYIAEKGDMCPTLPFVSTYWWTSAIYARLRARFDRFYTEYIHVRSDNTLFVHLTKSIMARLGKHYQGIEDLFGAQTLHLECESGRMDGEVKKAKFYRMPKKDYSRRYSTNCLSAIFEGDVPNRVSINDFVTYAGVMATAEELALQNSFFQRDLEKRKQQYAS